MVATQIFFIFTPIPGEMIQFDEHIFQMGWFNHQLGDGEGGMNLGACSWDWISLKSSQQLAHRFWRKSDGKKPPRFWSPLKMANLGFGNKMEEICYRIRRAVRDFFTCFTLLADVERIFV